MQKLLNWVKGGGLKEHGVIMGLMMLAYAYMVPIATRLGYVFIGVVVVPWSLCVLYAWVKKRDFCGKKVIAVYCVSVLCYLLSTVIRGLPGLGWTYGYLCLLLSTFVPLAISRMAKQRQLGRQLFVLGTIFVVCYLPLALIAVCSVYSGKVIRVPMIESPVGIQTAGAVNDRIRIFANPNTVGRYTVFSILFCAYAIARKRHWAARVFFVLAAAVNLLALAHSQSRTCYIALSLGAGVMAFRFLYLALDGKKLRAVVSAVLSIAVVFLVLSGVTAVYTTGVEIAQRNVSGGDAEAQVVDRFENEGQFDVYSSGRGDIYPNAIRYLMDHPDILAVGIGDQNSIELLATEYPEVLKYNFLHCSYLMVLYHGGVVALAAVAVFLCMLVRPALRMLTEKGDEENRGMFIVPVFLATIMMMSIPENMLFVTNGMGNFVFFWMVGYLLHYNQTVRPVKADGEARK